MSIRNKNTLVCDDVRVENTGKFIVIGLYTGPIGVPQIPVPVGVTFMHFMEADRPGRYSGRFRVEHLETGRRLVEGQAQVQVINPQLPVIAAIKVPLQIDREGAYNFILEVDGERDPIMTQFAVTLVRPVQQTGPMTMPML